MKLAIIPARGGSKRIPHKNIKNFLGKPIISYSIQSALDSNCFDEVMVSTDDPEIADIAKKYGAQVPFLRSEENSGDFATTAQAIEEVLYQYKKAGKEIQYFCCLYPTAPLINKEILKESFSLFNQEEWDALISICRFSYPIQRALISDEKGVRFAEPQFSQTRSQDLEERFHDAGAFYWGKTTTFLKEKTLFPKKTRGFELSELNVQDIDTLNDWALAELKFKLQLH